MLALGGVLVLVSASAAILSRKVPIYAAYSLIPLGIGLLLGVEPELVFSSAAEGIRDFLGIVCTILLSAGFFCGMAETGLYDQVISLVLRGRSLPRTALLFFTVPCLVVILLSGSITTCYLVILPAFLPLYDAAGIDRRILLTLASALSALALMLPWSSKMLLLSNLSGVGPVELWRAVLPLQVFGLALCLALCGFYSLRFRHGKSALAASPQQLFFPERPYARPRHFAVNCLLFVLCVTLLTTRLSSLLVLLGMLAVLLLVNYRDPAEEAAVLKRAMKDVVPITLVTLSIGMMLGVLDATGMTAAMAEAITFVIPPAAARYAPVVLMALFTPFLCIVHYHSFYALIPLLLALLPDKEVTMTVLPFAVLFPTCCSPMTGLTLLACRLCEEDPLRFVRFAIGPLCVMNYALLLFGVLTGLFF